MQKPPLLQLTLSECVCLYAHAWTRVFWLQRGADMHLSNHWSLSSLLHPHCFMTSLKPLPSITVILLLWTGCRQTPRTQPYGKCVIPVCCASFYFDYWLWIRRKLIRHDDNPLSSNTAVFIFTRTSLIYPTSSCGSVKAGSSVCVGCTKENSGFAGIRPLQQTNGSKKLAVAPSDTWSAFNLTGAQVGVGVGKGTAFV